MSSLDDLDFNDEDIVEDVTNHTIYFINSTPKLYEKIKRDGIIRKSISESCYEWAEEHNNEFGDLFQTELDMVDWNEVKKRV